MVTRKNGFSLIELLIVIALIAILTAIATASYTTMQKKARDSRRVSDLKAVQQGIEQSFADTQSYPSGDGCVIDTMYLPDNYPFDPKTKEGYSMSCPDTTSYCVCATLEVESGNSASNCDGTVTDGNFYCIHQRQ